MVLSSSNSRGIMALYSNNRYIISSRVRCKKLSELEFVSSIIILYLPLTNNIYSILLLLIHLTAPIKARFGFFVFFFSLFLIFLPEKNFSHRSHSLVLIFNIKVHFREDISLKQPQSM